MGLDSNNEELFIFQVFTFLQKWGNDQSWCGLNHVIFSVCKTALPWLVLDNRLTIVVALWLDCFGFFLASCVNHV